MLLESKYFYFSNEINLSGLWYLLLMLIFQTQELWNFSWCLIAAMLVFNYMYSVALLKEPQ